MSYDRRFLIDSLALLRHQRGSHMGAHQYAHHEAMRGDFPMSGSLGWQRYENDCPSYYILRCEEFLIQQQIVPELARYFEDGTSLVDLGTGTIQAVRSRSAKIVRALGSKTYAPIEASLKFCSEAGGVVQETSPATRIQPAIENFFSDNVEPALDEPALGYLGGITIANIEAPISTSKPTKILVKTLRNLAKIVGGGSLLLSTDANQSEAENKAMYRENGLFEINTLDRMAHELPMTGLEAPGFIYDPVWIAESGQLAHTAVATTDMSVSVHAREFAGIIKIKEGDRFHLKNSFKYEDDYFLHCAELAGFTPLKVWRHPEKPLHMFLLKSSPIVLSAEARISYR